MEQANSSVTVQYSERQSLASCIVSRQAGLTQGFEPHAVPVISPPSGRVGRASSQSVAACCMDLRVGGSSFAFGRHSLDDLTVQPHLQGPEGSNIWPTLFPGQQSTMNKMSSAPIDFICFFLHKRIAGTQKTEKQISLKL